MLREHHLTPDQIDASRSACHRHGTHANRDAATNLQPAPPISCGQFLMFFITGSVALDPGRFGWTIPTRLGDARGRCARLTSSNVWQ